MSIDRGLAARFKRQLATGNVVLFTGAGFSYDAIANNGDRVISVNDLKTELTRVAFPGNSGAVDDSTLADLYDVAASRASNRVKALFESRLQVDHQRTPERFNAWFSMPWKRHYTLNVDDLDQVVNGRTSLPRPITSISGFVHRTVQTPDLLSIHLNGRVRDFPEITFSVREYARRATGPDPWYELLTSDLLTSPVLFIGTVLEEPGLWQHIEMRRTRQPGQVELRPPSYIVSPSIPAARAALLKRFNIDWVQATEKEFFDEVLSSSRAESEQGHQAIQRAHNPVSAMSSLRSVDQLRNAATPQIDLKLFLQGREPVWADLEHDGFAVTRGFEAELARVCEERSSQVLIITGTAASGKSTTAMRLVLSLAAKGKKAFAYDSAHGSLAINQVVGAARVAHPEVLFIDDVDIFGETAGRLLVDLASVPGLHTIITTIRNSKLQSASIEDDLESVEWSEHPVPPLVDDDINLLLATLERAGSLGKMTGMSQSARRALFREQAGRQLLVAMFYATSGERLEDRVKSECEDLAGASRVAYGMAALATVDHQSVTKAEILMGLTVLGFNDDGNKVLNEVDLLTKRNLLVPVAPSGIAVRHRWIAEKSIDFFVGNGLIHKVVIGLAFALASQVDFQSSPHTRERRLLRRLINHDRLQRLVGDLDCCREVYTELQDRLAWDYHFWLQRGSLEVEAGDLALAQNYLESARSLVEGTDFLVENEYAYLLLRRASESPNSTTASEDADRALSQLEEAMRARGKRDSYPFHVYGSQGLRWARRAPMSVEQRKSLVTRLLNAVKEGRGYHPKKTDLIQLERDLGREYLLLAT